jgi:hypothetical protein
MENVFASLSAINLNDKVEKKDNLTYLSWAWAWSEVKKQYPDAVYEVKFFNGLPYICDENTGYMVFTEVTIQGQTHMMWLPVMDGANRAMKSTESEYKTKYGSKIIAAATMFDINKTLMRCLVKNLAMFGLGIYIYAGEDLPEGEVTEVVSQAKPKTTEVVGKAELKKGDDNWTKVTAYIEANKAIGYETILAQLLRKYEISDAIKKEIIKILK